MPVHSSRKKATKPKAKANAKTKAAPGRKVAKVKVSQTRAAKTGRRPRSVAKAATKTPKGKRNAKTVTATNKAAKAKAKTTRPVVRVEKKVVVKRRAAKKKPVAVAIRTPKTAVTKSKVAKSKAGAAAARSSATVQGLEKPAAPSRHWDRETDVLIIGFGGAGASAAIAAHDAGASVLVLEKAPANLSGGNSGCCMGFILPPVNAEDGFDYYKTLSSGTVKDDELIRTFVSEMTDVTSWLQELGVPLEVFAENRPGTFSELPGSTFNQYRVVGGGAAAFASLMKQVTDRNIDVMYEAPAKRIIQDPLSGEVIGATAETNGRPIDIRAKKAVILACGGYENNSEMTFNYNLPGLKIFPFGSPYNTGDGITMASAIGAKLWHMFNLQPMSYTVKAAAQELGCAIPFRVAGFGGNFIYVNKRGNRFTNEVKRVAHYKGPLEATFFDHDNAEYGNIPFYVIFDETFKQEGPVISRTIFTDSPVGWARAHNLFEGWSEDNEREIEKGWIIKASSLDELAQKIGISATGLAATVERYNQYIEKSEDPQFGRDAETMQPITTAPYYAMELALSLVNTQGGPMRNAQAQVLNTDEKPIARLYSAGELGSLFGHLYQAGNNFPEALIFGRIAGRNAAALAQRSS